MVPGLVSPEGTLLLGAPFAARDIGWYNNPLRLEIVAVLVVTGNPLVAFTDLIEQASRTGIELTYLVGNESEFPDHEPAFCRVEDIELGRHETKVEVADSLTCLAHGAAAVADGIQRRLEVSMHVGGQDDPFVSYITVTYDEHEIRVEPDPVTTSVQPPTEPPAFELPTLLTSLPEPGESLGGPLVSDDDSDVVLENSQMLAQLMPACDYRVVLEVEGQLDVMFDRYDDEIGWGPSALIDSEAFDYQGAQHRYRNYDAAGGDGLTLWGTQVPGESGYLMISRCTE